MYIYISTCTYICKYMRIWYSFASNYEGLVSRACVGLRRCGCVSKACVGLLSLPRLPGILVQGKTLLHVFSQNPEAMFYGAPSELLKPAEGLLPFRFDINRLSCPMSSIICWKR